MVAITKSLDVSAVASATNVSVKQQNQNTAANLRPEILVCIGQAQEGITVDTNKLYLASGNPDDAGVIFGFGSPLHRMAIKLFPKAGNGSKVDTYFLPVAAPSGNSSKQSIKTITPTVSSSGITKTINGYFRLKDQIFETAADVAGKVATNAHINPAKAPRGTILNSYEIKKYPFTLTKGMTTSDVLTAIKEALEDHLEIPFTMSINENVLTLTGKWKGSDSLFDFDIVDEDNEPLAAATHGVSLAVAVTQEASGVGTISSSALAAINTELGVTRVISQYASVTVLDALKEKFEAWHDGLTAQYVVCYSAIKAPESQDVAGTYDLQSLIASGTARRDDSVNVQIVGDFGELRPLEYKERDRLLKAGYSNIVRQANGSYKLQDLVTFYHPLGKTNPLYRFDRDITVVGNIAYDLMYNFRDTEEWKSVILASEKDVTTNPDVRTLKDVKAAANTRIGLLGLAGLIANYVEAQKNTVAEIDKSNPNRVNINLKFELTGVGRIFDLTSFIGFYFGE